MARPTKLTPKLKERIVQAVRAGAYIERACAMAGVSKSTYYRWLQRGRLESSGLYHEFAEAVEQAAAEAEVHMTTVLFGAARTDWRAALAFLERRFPERWRRQTTTELTGPDGGPFTPDRPDLSKLSPEELAELERMIERASAES